ncbi:MAG: T9SS type A sorting domain-containing protein [Saprospiraceae bacterium]
MAFAQHDLCGDGSLVAQVTSISGTSLGWAGLTMRESNAGGAKKVQLLTNLSNLIRREVCYTTNGTAFPQQFPSLNRYWLRLERQGNQFVGYTSANGVQWFQVMAVTVSMNACLEIGLVATNYEQNSEVTATFANVEVVDVLPLVRPANGVIQPAAPDFTAFPNPTTGELNLDFERIPGHSVRLEVYDVHGKAVKVVEIEAAERTERLDLSGLYDGVYVIRVKLVGAENVLPVLPGVENFHPCRPYGRMRRSAWWCMV